MRSSRVRLSLASLVFLAVALLPSCDRATRQGRTSEGRRPNILLISLDTVRYDATSLAPGGKGSTPFLESLAARGAHFSSAYSTFDLTTLSHFSMLTGFVQGWHSEIDQPHLSLPGQLGAIGYESFSVVANGNLKLSGNPYLRSFDHFTCLIDVWSSLDGQAKEVALARVDRRLEAYGVEGNAWTRLYVYSSSDEVLPRLEQELDRSGTPFFGFINLLDSHDPFFPDPATYDARGEAVPEGFEPNLRYRRLPPELLDPGTIADPERRGRVENRIQVARGRAWSTTFDLPRPAIDTYVRRYRAEVTEVDRAVQQIFDSLDERGLLDSTVVIITSDHGEAFGEDDLITHSFDNRAAAEATHRVPLVIVMPEPYGSSPGLFPDFVTIADIPPTIYDMVGLDWLPLTQQTEPGNFGRSLYTRLFDRAPAYQFVAKVDGRNLTDDEARRSREQAEENLRSLGYIQ